MESKTGKNVNTCMHGTTIESVLRVVLSPDGATMPVQSIAGSEASEQRRSLTPCGTRTTASVCEIPASSMGIKQLWAMRNGVIGATAIFVILATALRRMINRQLIRRIPLRRLRPRLNTQTIAVSNRSTRFPSEPIWIRGKFNSEKSCSTKRHFPPTARFHALRAMTLPTVEMMDLRQASVSTIKLD